MPKHRSKSGKRVSPGSSSSPRSRPHPAVAIIGAGRLGIALGQALKQAGYRIEVVAAKHQSSARRAAKLLSKNTVWLTERQLSQPPPAQHEGLVRCGLILISTPDDAIGSVAGQLAALFDSRAVTAKSSRVRRVVLHTSGALSASVLSPLRNIGITTGSLHPLVSISDPRASCDAFGGAFFAIEGDRSARRVAAALVRDLGGHSFSIAPNVKALYHAAAVTASGQVVALYDIALEMLVHCGLSPTRARQVLYPLLKSTTKNLAKKDPRHALTGTFARGDVATAERHIAAIKSRNLREALIAYVLLGQRSLGLAEKQSSNRAGLDQIAEILSTTVAFPADR